MISYIALEVVAAKFSRFAEEDGQEAAGEGVEGAAVPGFFGLVKPAGLLQGAVAADADGFVEQEDAVDFFACHRLSLLWLG